MCSKPQQSGEYDFLVIGSGFGGSVAAMRLSQKGYRVAVLEKGRRFANSDFPRSNWNIRKFLWSPIIRAFGPQKISYLREMMLLHGVGVGGGSLVYANTLLQPDQKVLSAKEWPSDSNWSERLAPHFQTAAQMLGVVENPYLDLADEELRNLASSMGAKETFRVVPVGVHFDTDRDLGGRELDDPYFAGDGPRRKTCNLCGGCMIGCHNGSKNTLDKNYLFFAEKWGAKIFPETEVIQIQKSGAGYTLKTKKSTSWFGKTTSFRGSKVIIASGVLGTVDLLLRNRAYLPNLSQQVGQTVRTNGESITGVTSFQKDRNFSKGIAIGASFQADQQTKIEAVRYPSGSGAMRWLAVPLTGPGGAFVRPIKFLLSSIAELPRWLRLWTCWDWARKSIILLTMQSVDTRIKIELSRTLLGRRLVGKKLGRALPSFLPLAQEATQRLSDQLSPAAPQNAAAEVLLGTPVTAHILGGAALADDPSHGVVSSSGEVFGHPGLYVCDGSVIPVNLGVNPSLTITALAEYFMSRVPIKEGHQCSEVQFSNQDRSRS